MEAKESEIILPNKWKTHKLSKLNIHKISDLYPFIPEPLPDELFTSWLFRLANMNYFSFVEFLRDISAHDYKIMSRPNQKQFWKYDLDNEIPEELLDYLSTRTGFSKEQLKNITLIPWHNRIYEAFFTPFNSRKRGGLRYCPKCLEEDEKPYYRKEWKLKYHTCCTKHNIYLLDRCSNPYCLKPLKISLMKHKGRLSHCVYCGFDLTQTLIDTIPKKDEYIKKISEIHSDIKNNKDEEECYEYLEALYFLSRFIINFFNFKDSKYDKNILINSDILEKERDKLVKYDDLFENIKICHFILNIAYDLLQNKTELKNLISKNQTHFNFWTSKGECPIILKYLRISKGPNPNLTKERIENAIKSLREKNKSLSYGNIAKKAKCANNFQLSHPHLREYVEKIRKKEGFKSTRNRTAFKITIKIEDVKNAIQTLKISTNKITYKTIAGLLDVKYWNLQSKPELINIIKPHLTNKSPEKKYFYEKEEIYKVIGKIRKLDLKISINEVCRQLPCHKTFFRNHPELKEIILKEKEIDQHKIDSLIPRFDENNELSKEAKKFEPIYNQYQAEMEKLGKNWRIAKNTNISKKLGIPLEFLIEIKMKYCPNTKNEVRRQREKGIIEIQLSEEAKRHELKYVEYMKKMESEGKSYKSARTNLLSKKLNIPLEFLLEIKKKY